MPNFLREGTLQSKLKTVTATGSCSKVKSLKIMGFETVGGPGKLVTVFSRYVDLFQYILTSFTGAYHESTNQTPSQPVFKAKVVLSVLKGD